MRFYRQSLITPIRLTLSIMLEAEPLGPGNGSLFFSMSCLGPCVSRTRQALEQSNCQACQVSKKKKEGHDKGQTIKILALPT